MGGNNMSLTLHELINAVTLEGEIIIRIWDENENDYSFIKELWELADTDLWVYSRTVKYLYPVGCAICIELEVES
jgi:hypothetical protein